jgi:hypothetical protein
VADPDPSHGGGGGDPFLKKNRTDDVRRLGCICYWLLSRGESHPFGMYELRRANLKLNKYELKNLSAESRHLIWSLIDQKVPCRTVWQHPFFWGGKMITNFFQTAHAFTFTDTYEMETFPITSVGNPDSDLGLWFQKCGGIPRGSHSVLESFVSGVSFRVFFIVHYLTRIFNVTDQGTRK